jgi:hypothetical protein
MTLMFKELRRTFSRWLPVDRYEKDEHIRNALKWILDRTNYRALLRAFVENDLAGEPGVSAEERGTLLACLSRAEHGEKVTAHALPRIAARSGRLKVGSWLRNACRRDLGLMPREANEVVPISCYCDDSTGRAVAATFRALGYAEETERLSQLRQVAHDAKLRTWVEVVPFVVGPCFASCGSALSFADCLLLPPTGSSFFYDPSLGAVHLSALNTIIVSVAAARAVGSYLQGLTIAKPLPAVEAARRVEKARWKVETLR